ncbi:hypothetical protein EGK_00390 [Macaca mulatta]|uniref:Uncharacterized protein n=1 Tax=Macaca mulatta TaxID=9544 RepID=G7MHP2_MACMU|nr:hypothetical protein EGK_00390 [Macaca mulatta]
MNHTTQTCFTPANTSCPPNYQMLKEEHEVAVLGAPHNPAPLRSTMIHIGNYCCLGFIAVTYSMKSRDGKMVGNPTGDQAYASTAKRLNVWALVLGILLSILLIVNPVLIFQVYR